MSLNEKALVMTAADVRRALKVYYPHPAYGILFEVARGTGANASRHLDAMSMSVWPSRGLSLNGIEIKVSRSDFRREVEQPQKAEELAKYCDYFFIAAPRGVVPIAEVPEKWGLLEVHADGKIREGKPAGKHEAVPPHRNLMAALFRAAMRPGDADDIAAAVAAAKAEATKGFEERVERAVAARRVAAEGEAESWRKFKALVTDERHASDPAVLAAVRAVLQSGVQHTWSGLRSLRASLAQALKGVDAVADTLAPEHAE